MVLVIWSISLGSLRGSTRDFAPRTSGSIASPNCISTPRLSGGYALETWTQETEAAVADYMRGIAKQVPRWLRLRHDSSCRAFLSMYSAAVCIYTASKKPMHV